MRERVERRRPDGISTTAAAGAPSGIRPRLGSLDATRGLAIVIMLMAGNPFQREFLPVQLRHPAWEGLRFADLFFPLFLFVVGVSMTLSRRAGSFPLVLRRVALLIAIGVALTSLKHGKLVLPGVLQHIAGSYLIAWLVLRLPHRVQPVAAVGILVGVWAGYVMWVGEGADPWGDRGTFAHAVNSWFLGGFATEGVLQTVTSSVTVLGGSFVGLAISRFEDRRALARWIGGLSLWLIAAALLMMQVVPISKRLWTPSFTVLTLASSLAWFALFVWLIDVRGHRREWRLFQDLGANPIAVYVAFMAVKGLLGALGVAAPELMILGSGTAGTMAYGLAWVGGGWVFARELNRREIHVKL